MGMIAFICLSWDSQVTPLYPWDPLQLPKSYYNCQLWAFRSPSRGEGQRRLGRIGAPFRLGCLASMSPTPACMLPVQPTHLSCSVLSSSVLPLTRRWRCCPCLHFLCLCSEKPCAGKALYTRTGCLPRRLMEPVVLLLPSPAYAYK